jgi:hypothetical protein
MRSWGVDVVLWWVQVINLQNLNEKAESGGRFSMEEDMRILQVPCVP